MKIPIIGACQIKFGELWDKGIKELIREAGEKALKESRLKPDDIGKLYIANVFAPQASGQSLLSSIAFEELGISNSICINAGDASGSAAIHEAANSILAKEIDIAMVLGVEKTSDLKTNEVFSLSSGLISQEESFAGATVQSQLAIITRKYSHDFKLNAKDLSFIPSKNHKNAVGNEYAQYSFELTEEKISSTPMSAEPIRMFDCASYCDGAAALIMCSERAARKFKRSVKGYLLASASASGPLSLSKRKSIIENEPTVKAGNDAFNFAKLKRDDIDLMELHDFAPISEVLAVEDLGFAKKGHGLQFIKNNINNINLSGGLKACGHALGATGVRQAVDLLRLLKAKKMKKGITHTIAGTGGIAVVNLFGV
ncbi:MAG: beta-ketoacyl synthase N-terminal-like domain-containing protein [Nanoarchaeota archaeon]